MTHEDRLALGRELTARLLDRHGTDALLAVGLHGSVVHGDERDEPDLDLAVVTAGPEVEVADRALRHRGVVVELGVITAEAYLHEAAQIGPTWPLAADQYVNHLPVHDPGGPPTRRSWRPPATTWCSCCPGRAGHAPPSCTATCPGRCSR
jgi:hypothetical protein